MCVAYGGVGLYIPAPLLLSQREQAPVGAGMDGPTPLGRPVEKTIWEDNNMKECPKCSTKNPNDSAFCKGCGASLEGVEIAQDPTSVFLNRAGNLLSDGARKAKEAAAIGAQKAQKAVQDGAEKMREQQNEKKATAQPQKSMLIDPGETVIASIGNSYLQNMVGSRSVKSGFALLTEKRVYYSGQAFSGNGRGGMITEECIIPVENITRTRFIYNQGIVRFMIGLGLAIYGGLMALFQFANGPEDIPTLVGLGMLLVGACLIISYFLNRSTVFEISFPGGGFTFNLKWYPIEDMREFQRQLHLVKDKANHTKVGDLT